jgi:diguanylate cyclase (GGDEF)-like protein/PAS domain S-box-containing protein
VRVRAITAYLGMGATAIVAYFVLPDGAGSLIWAAIAFSAPVAILYGIRRYRPVRPAPWYLLAAGLAFYAFGDVLWNVFDGGASVGPGVAAYALGYPLMALGCLFLVRSDRRTSMLAMVDALVGACGLAVILWVVVLSKGVDGSGPTFVMVVNASYSVLDILLLTLLLRLTWAERTPEPAFRCLMLAFSLLLVTDLAYSWLSRSTPDPSGTLLDLGWIASYMAVGLAALHPSMASLTQRKAPDPMLSPFDVVWWGLPILVVPVLMLFGERHSPLDIIVQGVGGLLLGALVLVRIVFSARDQDQAHRLARVAELEYRAVFDGSPVAVLKVQEGGEILDANPAAERLLEYEGGLRGRPIRTLLVDPAVDGPRIRMSVTALIDGPSGAHATWTMRVLRGDGSSFWSSMNTSIAKDTDGATLFGITTVEDVTRERAEEEHLRFRALHDPLTGLPNRDLLDENMRRALARARRGGTRVAVLFLDLDGFKDVNDRMGHAVGDELLRALAERLVSSSRGGDMVARLGGDEFVIVVEDIRNDGQAEASTARFLDEVRRPVVLGGARISLEASIGLVVADASDVDPDEILRRADSAMYEAKRSGRGGWRRFGAETAAGLGA